MTEADRFFERETEGQVAETATLSGLPTPEEMAELGRAYPGPDEAWAAYRREAGGLPLWRVPPLAWIAIGAAVFLYGMQYVYNLLFPPALVIQDETLFAPSLIGAAAVLVVVGLVVVILGLLAFMRRRRFFKAFGRAAQAVSGGRA